MPEMASTVNGPSQSATDLLVTLASSLHHFLPATSTVHEAAVLATKQFLDPLAHSVSHAQQARQSENRKKRKRDQHQGEGRILRVQEIHTNGFGANQIWEQARRVTDAAAEEIERDLQKVFPDQTDVYEQQRETTINGHDPFKTVRLGEDGFEVDSHISEDHLEGIENVSDDGSNVFEEKDEEVGEDYRLRDSDDENLHLLSDDSPDSHVEKFVPDVNNLNDGFFSIDDFNKQSQFLEQKDARGEDENPSDEEEINWGVDPFSIPLPKTTKTGVDDGNEESEEEDDDHTFGDPDALSEDDVDGEAHINDIAPGLGNTNEIQYTDFFEPPPKKPSKTKRMRALPKTQPTSRLPAEDPSKITNDIERAMADVRRDLLDSDDEAGEDDNSASEEDRAGKGKNLSTHEKQKAAIAAEIRKLEAAAVAKRDWTLSGEARAADRPMNSLIEEDLEFERAGKPIPVVTAEVSEGIEALIKRRIIAREFDEVLRRRPEALGSASDTRRGRVELNDSQSKQGLAEIYEQEHIARTDPNYESTLDKKTKKAHAEIDRLWKEVSGQLDVLSNLHFKPKRAEVEIKTVEDKPTIRMEDARPGGVAGEANMLAPQEIFRAGEDGKETGILVRKSGASANKEEMTREEKLRRRRRDKERHKKASLNKPMTVVGADGKPSRKNKRDDKNDIISDLKKGNVKVIGKKGQLETLGKSKVPQASAGSSAFKL